MNNDETEGSSDSVLTPADLEKDNDCLRTLNGTRYVISSDGGTHRLSATDGGKCPESALPNGEQDRQLADLRGAYAIEIHARSETTEESSYVDTNSVSEAFESLIRWYSGQIAPNKPPEAVVEVLLMNSDLDIEISRD